MIRNRWMASLTGMVLISTAFAQSGSIDTPARVYDIPKLDNIVVDGKSDDWGDYGYIIDDIRKMNSPGRTVDVDARIGWDEKGILLLLKLSGNNWTEAAKVDDLWQAHSVEIYMTPRKTEPNLVQWVITSGMDTNHPDIRKKLYDYRTDPEIKETPVADIEVAVDKDRAAGKCTMEILFPFGGLPIQPHVGRELGFQLIINNAGQNVWFQGVKLWRNPHHVQRIRLAVKPGPRDIFQVTRSRQFKNSLVMELGITKRGTGYPADNRVDVMSGGIVVTNLVYKGGRLDLRLSPPPYGKPYRKLVFVVDGEPLGEFELNTDDLYAAELDKTPMTFAPAVFVGNSFPACDFADPVKVKSLIGDYTVTRRFFDSNMNEVKDASKPGRYGAMVTVKSGEAVRNHYITLYRLAGDISAGELNPGANITASADQLRTCTGIGADLVKTNLAAIADALLRKDAVSAIRLAALHDRTKGMDRETWSNREAVRDNRWWLRMRHKLGEDIRKLSPHVYAVNTPPGYNENPDKKYGLFYYCPGRGFDCDETWEGIKVHSAHGLFRAGSSRVAAPFLSCMAHSYDGYTPAEIAQIMEIIEVLYRLDPRRVCIAGHSGGAEHARIFANNYPDRLVAVILMAHGPWVGKNLTGKGRAVLSSSPDKGYFDIDRHYGEIDDSKMTKYFDTFSKRTYDWIESLTKTLPED